MIGKGHIARLYQAVIHQEQVLSNSPAPRCSRKQSNSSLLFQMRPAQLRGSQPPNRWNYHPSALPLPRHLERLYNLSHSRRARACSEDFWADDGYDPSFWRKNLRPGNIWVAPARHPVSEEGNVSQRTILVRA